MTGLLSVVLVALAAGIRDERLYAISGSLIGLGIRLCAGATSYVDLIIATFVQSVCLHLWQVEQHSLVARSVATGERALRLGQINSLGAGALLLAVHSELSIWTRPLIRRLIDRIGEQRGWIIPERELSSSLATGSTINHLLGVAVPIVSRGRARPDAPVAARNASDTALCPICRGPATRCHPLVQRLS